MEVADVIMEAIDDAVTDVLCVECEHRDCFPETRYLPEEWVCPARFDPSDESCGKHRQYLRIRALAVVIQEALEHQKALKEEE